MGSEEKIFWGLIAVVFAGLAFAFIFVTAVQPLNAASSGQKAAQQQGGNTYYAPYGQGAAGAQAGGAGAAQGAGAAYAQGAQAAGAGTAQQAQAAAGDRLAAVNGGAQEVQLTVQGGSYMPNPIRVKKGVPVRLVADLNSVRGCASSIVIPDFGVRKAVRAGDNVIEFTPDKSGTFQFSCSMGMYRGTIVVEEADGTVAAYAGTAPAVTGGCKMGAGGGGCGCGG